MMMQWVWRGAFFSRSVQQFHFRIGFSSRALDAVWCLPNLSEDYIKDQYIDMKYVLLFAALAAGYWSAESKTSPPKVQVYSRNPGEYGKENTLMCRVTGFHPPNIEIRLMRNDVEIPDAVQSDLAFESDWHFHLTRHVSFTPQSGEKYACKVTHDKASPKTYVWEPNM